MKLPRGISVTALQFWLTNFHIDVSLYLERFYLRDDRIFKRMVKLKSRDLRKDSRERKGKRRRPDEGTTLVGSPIAIQIIRMLYDFWSLSWGPSRWIYEPVTTSFIYHCRPPFLHWREIFRSSWKLFTIRFILRTKWSERSDLLSRRFYLGT